MCIICISKSGVQQPIDTTLRAMFRRNPHGAGYMYARDGKVTIHKGFMNIEDFLSAVHAERFTPQDSVVYHFRISTQAGVNAAMTHPFPLSNHPLEYLSGGQRFQIGRRPDRLERSPVGQRVVLLHEGQHRLRRAAGVAHIQVRHTA